MKYPKAIICAVVLLGLFFVVNIAAPVQAQGTTTITEGQKIFAAVKRARTLLQEQVNQVALDKKVKSKTVTSRNVTLGLTLAVWNEVSDEIEFVKIKKFNLQITTVSDRPYKFKVVRDNGVNSEFEIVGESNLHVLALIHPIFVDIGTTKRPKYRLDDVVYVPYSSYLKKPEIIQAGKDYLNKNVQAVYQELRALGVRSRAFPDLSLAEAISPEVVKSIIAIEHIGVSLLVLGNTEDYLENFYIILATNENTAYAYSRSTASARGLAQFIPSTYASLVKKRPDLVLVKDFVQGTTDPYNIIKAQIAYLDLSLTELSQAVRQAHEGDGLTIGSYLAAMYNGGGTRTRRAIKLWGDAWAEDHRVQVAEFKKQASSAQYEVNRLKKALAKSGLTAAEKKKLNTELQTYKSKVISFTNQAATAESSRLKLETVLYVAKFKLVYDNLIKAQ
jgi:hypothetical protein